MRVRKPVFVINNRNLPVLGCFIVRSGTFTEASPFLCAEHPGNEDRALVYNDMVRIVSLFFSVGDRETNILHEELQLVCAETRRARDRGAWLNRGGIRSLVKNRPVVETKHR